MLDRKRRLPRNVIFPALPLLRMPRFGKFQQRVKRAKLRSLGVWVVHR